MSVRGGGGIEWLDTPRVGGFVFGLGCLYCYYLSGLDDSVRGHVRPGDAVNANGRPRRICTPVLLDECPKNGLALRGKVHSHRSRGGVGLDTVQGNQRAFYCLCRRPS